MSKKTQKAAQSVGDSIDTGPVKSVWVKIVDNVPQTLPPPPPIRRVFFAAANDGSTTPSYFGYFDLDASNAPWVGLMVDSMNGLVMLKLEISSDEMNTISMTSKDDFGSLTTPLKTNTSNRVHSLVTNIIVYT